MPDLQPFYYNQNHNTLTNRDTNSQTLTLPIHLQALHTMLQLDWTLHEQEAKKNTSYSNRRRLYLRVEPIKEPHRIYHFSSAEWNGHWFLPPHIVKHRAPQAPHQENDNRSKLYVANKLSEETQTMMRKYSHPQTCTELISRSLNPWSNQALNSANEPKRRSRTQTQSRRWIRAPNPNKAQNGTASIFRRRRINGSQLGPSSTALRGSQCSGDHRWLFFALVESWRCLEGSLWNRRC